MQRRGDGAAPGRAHAQATAGAAVWIFSALSAVVLVAWIIFYTGNLAPAGEVRTSSPIPNPTTPHAWPEALSLISAGRSNFSALSQAERNVLTGGYRTIPIRSASKCGSDITETTDLIMAVGDEIEAKKPSVESPRGKALLSVTRDMPDGSYCFLWLAEVIALLLNAP